jgi:hypothetical protein
MTTPIAGLTAGAGGMAGNTQGARRALRGLDTGLAIFFGGVAAVAATDATVLWFFHDLRGAVERYGWGNVPPEEIPPFDFFDKWGVPIDLGAIALYGAGFLLAMLNARRLAEAIGVRSWNYGWGWTVGTLFIPIVCLFRPWLGFAEIRRAIFASAAAGRATKDDDEFSTFTLILGLAIVVGAGIVNTMGTAANRLATPTSLASFYGYVDQASHMLLTMAAAQAATLAIMLTYLLTIRRKAVLLANRIDLEAFD